MLALDFSCFACCNVFKTVSLQMSDIGGNQDSWLSCKCHTTFNKKVYNDGRNLMFFCYLMFFCTQKDEEDINMSLSELRGLQSRLMLIAGEAEKGKDDVNQFVNTLASVEGLAKAYVKLRLSGCLLFEHWIALIR